MRRVGRAGALEVSGRFSSGVSVVELSSFSVCGESIIASVSV